MQEDQEVLSVLSAYENIHVVASIDHINSLLMWDMRMLSTWSWSMHDITTFETYVEEVAEMPYLIAGKMDYSSHGNSIAWVETTIKHTRAIITKTSRHHLGL